MGVETALIVGALVSAAGTAGSAAINSRQNSKATKAQTAANDQAVQIEKDNEERRRKEFDQTTAENKRATELEQAREQARYDTSLADARRKEAQDLRLYGEKRGRLKPYEDTGHAALSELGKMAGLTITKSAAPTDMSGGWSASALTPPQQVPSFPVPQTMGDIGKPKGVA